MSALSPRFDRVFVERWIFVGDYREKFADWLREFATTYHAKRILGYILDLDAGGLLATLDLHNIKQEAYYDINLLIAERKDDASCDAFACLIADCNQETAPNYITAAFHENSAWPKLASWCTKFPAQRVTFL